MVESVRRRWLWGKKLFYSWQHKPHIFKSIHHRGRLPLSCQIWCVLQSCFIGFRDGDSRLAFLFIFLYFFLWVPFLRRYSCVPIVPTNFLKKYSVQPTLKSYKFLQCFEECDFLNSVLISNNFSITRQAKKVATKGQQRSWASRTLVVYLWCWASAAAWRRWWAPLSSSGTSVKWLLSKRFNFSYFGIDLC